MREFTDVQGRKVMAELVSHNGSGLIELRRDGGAVFQLEVSRFSPEDRALIQQWIAQTAPKLDYRFEVKVAPEKMAGNRVDLGYKKVKNERWAYKVEIKNLARNDIGPLKVEYRLFVKNEADRGFISYDAGGFYSGEKALADVLKYNQTTAFITESVILDSVQYDTVASSRFKDALRGLMLRIKDSSGKVVHEYVSPITTLNGKTWDDIPKEAEVKR